jgi:hypothetical protein
MRHRRGSNKPGPLKDLDFIEMGMKIPFETSAEADNFFRIIKADAEFLASNGMIDYSLLVGIKGREMHAAIIDIMTPYTPKKKAEYYSVGLLRGKDKISCNPPQKYMKRFCNFVWHAIERCP